MADFNEKLIFNLEVNSSEFASKLKKAVNDAVKNLTPELTVRASDIKLVGKVKALDIFDLSGLGKAIQAAVGSSLSPTGRGGVNPGRVPPPRVPEPGPTTAKAVPGGNVIGEVFRGLSTKELNRAVRDAEKEAKRLAANFSEATREKIGRISPGPKSEAGTSQAIDAIQRQILAENEKTLARLRESKPSGFAELTRRAAEATREKTGRISPAPARNDLIGRIDEPDLSKLNAGLIKSANFIEILNKGAASASVTLAALGSAGIAGLNRFNPLSLQTRSNIAQLSSQLFRFASINLSGIVAGFGRVAGAARTALSPIVSLTSALVRSTAILTGSGLLFGGPAFIPVATVRAASAAFDELNAFTKDVAISVVQFSDKIASLQGADRVSFVSDKFRELGASVQDTSAKFGLTSKEVSAGLFEILSAQVGITSTAERLEALNAASRVAVGGATDVASAFKGLLAINAAFSTSFQESSDKLFAIQRLGIAPVKDLAPQLGRVASIASEAGASVDELGAAISTITSKGVPLETTFTGLRQVFAELASGGGPSIQKLVSEIKSIKGIDISFDINTLRAEGGLKKFLDTLNEIRKTDPGLIGKLFPDTRAISVILPLLGGVSRFSKDLVQISKASGEAQAAQEVVTNTLAGSYDRLKASISNTVVTSADHIASIIGLKSIIDGVIEKLNGFQQALRGISSVDLSNLLLKLTTTDEGIGSIGNFIVRQFAGLSARIVKASAPVIKVFSSLGIAAGRILASGVISGFGQIFDFGKLEDSLVGEGLKLVLPKSTFDSLSLTESVQDSLKAGFDFTGPLSSFQSFADAMSDRLGEIGSSFTGEKFEDILGNTKLSLKAGAIRESAKELKGILSQEIEGIQPFNEASLDSLKNVVQEIQSFDIARAISSKKGGAGFFAFDASALNDASKELRASLIEIGGLDVRIPDATIAGVRDVSEQIDIITRQLAEKRQLSLTIKDPLAIRFINSEISELESKIKSIPKNAGLAFDKSLFDQLGIKNAGDNIKSQLVALNNELPELEVKLLADRNNEELKKKFAVVKNLRDFIAIEVLRFSDFFNFEGIEGEAKSRISEISKFISSGVNESFKGVFDKIQILPNVIIDIPKSEIAKVDRDSLTKRLQLQVAQAKSLLAPGILPSNSLFTALRGQISDAVLSMETMLKVLLKIPEAVNSTSNIGEGFSTISFLIEDTSKIIDQVTRDIKDQLNSEKTAVNSTAEAYNKLAESKNRAANAGSGSVSGIGSVLGSPVPGSPAPLYIDNSNNTTNVTPVSGFPLRGFPLFVKKLPPK